MRATQSGEPCHDAREDGCTCDWIRGFNVGPIKEEWYEKILNRDPECPVPAHRNVVESR